MTETYIYVDQSAIVHMGCKFLEKELTKQARMRSKLPGFLGDIYGKVTAKRTAHRLLRWCAEHNCTEESLNIIMEWALENDVAGNFGSY